MKLLKDFLLILLLILASLSILAQDKFTVSGKIIDSQTEAVVPYATISRPDGAVLALTDTLGSFSISLEEGTYTFVISSFGFKTFTKELFVNQDLSLSLSIESDVESLGPVELHGDRNDFGINRLKDIEGTSIYAGKKTEVITVDELVGTTATNSSRQIYSKIPGINIWEIDPVGIQLEIGGRGLNPSRTSNFNTRQNGYDISADALGYPESYYSPPAEAIDKIEIIRGAGALQYGPQFGGFINFRLKKGPLDKKLEVTSRQSGGSYGFFNSFNSLGGTVAKGKINYYTFYQYKTSNGWRPNSAIDVHTAFASVTYKPSVRFEVTGEYTLMHYLAQQAGGLTDKQFEADPRQSVRDRNWFKVNWNLWAIKGDYLFSENLKLNSRFFGLIADRTALGVLDAPNKVDFGLNRDLWRDDFRNFGNETRLLYTYKTFGNESAFVTGFRYYNGFTFKQQGEANDGFTGTRDDFTFLRGEELDYSAFSFPSSNSAFFIENVFQITPKLALVPGIRMEHISTEAKGFYSFIPKDLAGNVLRNYQINETKKSSRSFVIGGLGATYDVTQSLEFYANISQNYRSINFNDMRIVNPNLRVDPDMEDETGYTADAGIRGSVEKLLYFDLGVFTINYDNRIGVYQTYDTITYIPYRYRTNVSRSRNLGFESFFELDLWRLIKGIKAKSRFSYFSNLSLIDARYKSSKEKAFEDKKVEFVPSVIWRTGLTYKNERFGVTYQFSYTSSQYTDATNAEFTPSGVNGFIPTYYVMDLRTEYYFKKRFALFASLNNLTNNIYFTRRADGYPGPGIIPADGISFFFTLQVKL